MALKCLTVRKTVEVSDLACLPIYDCERPMAVVEDGEKPDIHVPGRNVKQKGNRNSMMIVRLFRL